MEKHFAALGETPEAHLRKVIYQLMLGFESIYDAIDELLAFRISEEKAKDIVESHFISMVRLNQTMHALVSGIEKIDLKAFEQTRLYEAMRRTYNFLTPLNDINLDEENWVAITARVVVDKLYYRQIKALVY